MSEFKFSCPICGQDILCDTTQAGTQTACPVCKAAITVPKETTGAADVSTPASAPPALPGNPAITAQRTSRLAIASLVCSLSSFVTCVGWLPGIICGHLAKSRIRRDLSLKGSGLAMAGLVIGYLILISEAGSTAFYVWRISAAVKQGFENARQELATNTVIVTQTQSTTVSNESQPVEPVQTGIAVTNNQLTESVKPETIAATNPQIESGQSAWTADLSKVSFPDHPVSGKFHGLDFTARTASFRNGDLRIRAANGMQLDVYRLGADIEGHNYEIQRDDDDRANPRVRMTWNEGGATQTATFNQGYGLKLQFGPAINRTISGKIYLCFPDDAKSCVAGTFEVRLPKPQ